MSPLLHRAAHLAALLLIVLVWSGPIAAQAPTVPPVGAGPAAPLEHPHEDEIQAPLGDTLHSGLERIVGEFGASLREDVAAARVNLHRLRGLGAIEPAEALAVLRSLAGPVAASFAVAVLGRLVLLPLFRGIGRRAVGRGPLGVALLALAKIALDLLLIVAAAAAAVTVSVALAPDGSAVASDHVLIGYFLTFVIAGSLIVVLRAVLSPAVPELRPFPMRDPTARYWTRQLGAVVVIIAVGELLLPPILARIATPTAASAVAVAAYATAVLYLMLLVILHRKAPREHFERLAAEREEIWPIFLAFAAHFWHWPALACLVYFLHQLVTAGAGGVVLLRNIAEIAAALALAILVSRLLGQLSLRGLSLSEPVRRAMPGVEARLNDFFRAFISVLRYVIVAVWIGFVLQSVGVAGLAQWLQHGLGVDILGATISLVVIALIGFGIWLGISSWIEYRLTPHGDRVPTAREQTLLSLLKNAAAVTILLVCLYYALLGIGISLAPLLASAGVIALAISWGSQKLVQDVITGLFIQLENAINVGDVIEAGGKVGVVEKLTIRSVSLRDVEGVYHLIPFSSVDSVSNHMKGFSYHVADISIAYGADIDAAKAAMLAAYDQLSSDPQWRWRLLGNIEWFGVQALAENAVVLRARLKTRPGDQWAVGRAYAEAAKKRLDAEGIEIPFPQRKIWLASDEGADRAPAPLRPTRQTRSAGAPTDADEDEG